MLFGASPVTIPKLVAAVSPALVAGAPHPEQARCIETAIGKLGEALGYAVSYSEAGHPRTTNGWGLDVVWLEPGRGTVLAAACQWGNAGEIGTDFRLLMEIKAPQKVMVFFSHDASAERRDILFRTDAESILKVLGMYLIDFSQHVEGEQYVLLDHPEHDGGLHVYEFRVPKDGRLKADFSKARELFAPVELGEAVAR